MVFFDVESILGNVEAKWEDNILCDPYIRKELNVRTRSIGILLGCALCGEHDFEYFEIEFHHLNSNEKEGNIFSYPILRRETRFYNELSKTVPVCQKCHDKIHGRSGTKKLSKSSFRYRYMFNYKRESGICKGSGELTH